LSERFWLRFSRFWCSSKQCMKSLIPTWQDYIGSGAWYQNSITKPSEIRFRASLAKGRRDVRLEKL
jgi:hypothetical protein